MEENHKALLEALDNWLEGTTAFADGGPVTQEQKMEFLNYTIYLIKAIRDAVSTDSPEYRLSYYIAESAMAVTARFLFDSYSDDDTDAPCDVEYDVHELIAHLDPTYTRPEEINPSYVIGTQYPPPDEG